MFATKSTLTTNKCVETSTSCAGGEFDLTTLVNLDLQLAACENDEAVCGSTNFFVTSSVTPTADITIATNMPVNTKCTYLVDNTYWFPLYKYDGTATADTDLEISFMHFTEDGRFPTALNDYPSDGTHMTDTTSYTGNANYPRK